MKIRNVIKLKQPFAGWVADRRVNGRNTVFDTVGFGLSNEFFDSAVDFEERDACQRARRLKRGPLAAFADCHIKSKTCGSVIKVKWEKASLVRVTVVVVLYSKCF